MEVPPQLRGQLLATFNSGFKLEDDGGGFAALGHLYAPLRDGQATLIGFRDGSVDVREWTGGSMTVTTRRSRDWMGLSENIIVALRVANARVPVPGHPEHTLFSYEPSKFLPHRHAVECRRRQWLTTYLPLPGGRPEGIVAATGGLDIGARVRRYGLR